MKLEATISPIFSIILVMESKAGQIPDTFDRKLIAVTPSCVAVCTFPEQDGKTTIVLTDEPSKHVLAGEALVFVGSLEVPGGLLSILTAEDENRSLSTRT